MCEQMSDFHSALNLNFLTTCMYLLRHSLVQTLTRASNMSTCWPAIHGLFSVHSFRSVRSDWTVVDPYIIMCRRHSSTHKSHETRCSATTAAAGRAIYHIHEKGQRAPTIAFRSCTQALCSQLYVRRGRWVVNTPSSVTSFGFSPITCFNCRWNCAATLTSHFTR